MASSLAAAANAVAAAATMSGGHSGVGLNNALVGLQGNGLAQAASQQGLSNLNVNPLLCNNQVGTSFYERVLKPHKLTPDKAHMRYCAGQVLDAYNTDLTIH